MQGTLLKQVYEKDFKLKSYNFEGFFAGNFCAVKKNVVTNCT